MGVVNRVRVPAVALVVALVSSGCAWLPVLTADPGGPHDPVRIVAPANRTQLGDDGSVTVEVRFARRVNESTFRAWLRTGLPADATDVTDRFAVTGAGATATFTAADLAEGVTKLRVSARTGRHGHRESASVVWSWEPQIDASSADGCDFLAASKCLLPFPNDYFTVVDPASDTGRRVHVAPGATPVNVNGVHVDPAEWNRNDGFSPGSSGVLHVPGVDLALTGAAPITDIQRSLDADAPILVIDADTLERHPVWAELDSKATSDATRALFIRAGINFREGHRYIFAVRNLKDSSDATIEASRAFQVYRDLYPTFVDAVEARRLHMEDIFLRLAAAGVARDGLYLAWDFTVASERNLSERMLHIRDDAFASLGGAAPEFSVTSVQNEPDYRIYRRVTGTFQVPLYLTGTGAPGARMSYAPDAGPDALPVRNGSITARFVCNIPRSATEHGADPVSPARGVVYGHGLLGAYTQANSSSQLNMAYENRMVYCGTDTIGMSEEDVPNVINVLSDLSNFATMPDRLQQGILNTLFLARLLKDPDGFASDPAFRAGASDTSVLVPNEVYYEGISQGGIVGGAATAVSTEWTRAALGVPGMNYSVLLDRSVDFDLYGALLNPNYPDELDRAMGLIMIQMLWDRGEANGYAWHMTDDPYPGTPEHQVLIHEAFGDHQVANVTTEIEARTIGAHIVRPALAAGRHTDVEPFWGIPAVPHYPFEGSAMVVWDSGNPAPPTTNQPPRPPAYGSDPHAKPRAQLSARQQKGEFLRVDGMLIEVCGGAPCLAP